MEDNERDGGLARVRELREEIATRMAEMIDLGIARPDADGVKFATDVRLAMSGIAESAAGALDRLNGVADPWHGPVGGGSKRGTYTLKVRKALGYTVP